MPRQPKQTQENKAGTLRFEQETETWHCKKCAKQYSERNARSTKVTQMHTHKTGGQTKKEYKHALKRQQAQLNQGEIRLRTLQHYGLRYRGEIQRVTAEPTAAEATEGEERRKTHGAEATRTIETKTHLETTNLEDMENSEDAQSKNKKEETERNQPAKQQSRSDWAGWQKADWGNNTSNSRATRYHARPRCRRRRNRKTYECMG